MAHHPNEPSPFSTAFLYTTTSCLAKSPTRRQVADALSSAFSSCIRAFLGDESGIRFLPLPDSVEGWEKEKLESNMRVRALTGRRPCLYAEGHTMRPSPPRGTHKNEVRKERCNSLAFISSGRTAKVKWIRLILEPKHNLAS
jgi:hypothetical protein